MVLFDEIEDIFQKWRGFSECSRDLISLATAIGIIALVVLVLKITLSVIRGLRLYVFSQSSCCKTDYITRYGKWAVISGSTDGIGLAMARDLARRGHSIIVMGRNVEKLANTKASLESEPNVGEVITVCSDLSDSSPENFERIKAEIDPDHREIGILINNAGIFPEEFKLYQNYDMNSLRKATNLNAIAVLYLTHMTLPGMVNRGKGLVVNVSSIFGQITAGYVGVYGPSKAFLESFSKQLYLEYGPLGVDIVNVSPGPVFTKQFIASSKMGQVGFINPTPETFARSVINALSTRINSMCGTAFHEFLLISSKVVSCLGLHSTFLRHSYKTSAKTYSFAP